MSFELLPDTDDNLNLPQLSLDEVEIFPQPPLTFFMLPDDAPSENVIPE